MSGPERPTFSPFWHRVRELRPRLRPHVQVHRQHYRGRRWHVVQDPASNQFFRLNPIAHEFVGMLDGRRTVEQVWKMNLERHGDAAPTQQEVIRLIGQLYGSNLLSVDAPPETEQLLRRSAERRKKKVIQQAIGIMYFRIRMFNPDGLISVVEPVLRPLLSRWGLVLWVAFVLAALVALLPRLGELIGGVGGTLAPSNWPWLIAVFIVIKAIHELGHGTILKRFGGQTPEFGIMILVLFPCPYVDASSAWSLPHKWKRIAVGAGGMIFELAIAAAAVFVWLNTDDGLLRQLAYNAIFIASVSTILFNANPLMRFDGYYILSDLIEVPNLMTRAQNMIKYLFKRHMYRMKDESPPTSSRSERGILLTYGILALAYRVFLFITITLYVMGQLFAIGLVLAIWTAVAWFVLPSGKFIHWLSSNPALAEHRWRAVATTVLAIGACLLLLGAVPAPDHRRAAGVVESQARSGVFFAAEGFVSEVHASAGDRVRAGEPIVELENPEYTARLEVARAMLLRMEMRERDATVRDQRAVGPLRRMITGLREEIEHLEWRMDQLVVRAPHDGVIVGQDPRELVGRFVSEGEPLCELVDVENVRIVAALNQREASWHFELGPEAYDLEMRLVSRADRTVDGRVRRVIDAGQRRLPHAALGHAGGGAAELEQGDDSGLMARRPSFIMEVEPEVGDGEVWLGAPGERVRLRFRLPSKPLLHQWSDRLQKLMQGRTNL